MSEKEKREFRQVDMAELTIELFGEFRRRQVVEDCLRREKGQWILQSAPFVDDWSEKDYVFLVQCLKETLKSGGQVFGFFSEGILKGFASVDGRSLGSQNQYLDLTSLHVSEEMRGLGIGKKLFVMAALWARDHGAGKLYISSHSAVETQRFYEAMGCTDALECSMEHMRQEPCDRQLELDLSCLQDF